jgi:hypothetical protein
MPMAESAPMVLVASSFLSIAPGRSPGTGREVCWFVEGRARRVMWLPASIAFDRDKEGIFLLFFSG